MIDCAPWNHSSSASSSSSPACSAWLGPFAQRRHLTGLESDARADRRSRTARSHIWLRLGTPWRATVATVPADLSSDPRAQLYIIDHLAPGAVIHRRVEVSSTGAAPTTVEVYAGAASIAGGSFIGAAAPAQNELSGWMSLDQSAVTLRPQGSAPVDVTIAVPSRASSGERYAVIWASVSSPPAAPGGVLLVNRVGIRVYLDVGPGGDPPSDFQIENIAGARTADGRPEVIARVHNTGLRALDIRGDLQLSDGPGSLSAGPFPVTTGSTLAPGDAAPVEVLLDRQLPDGPWTVRLRLASGLLERTATATIRFPAFTGNNECRGHP
jgi:hypothetical protein